MPISSSAERPPATAMASSSATTSVLVQLFAGYIDLMTGINCIFFLRSTTTLSRRGTSIPPKPSPASCSSWWSSTGYARCPSLPGVWGGILECLQPMYLPILFSLCIPSLLPTAHNLKSPLPTSSLPLSYDKIYLTLFLAMILSEWWSYQSHQYGGLFPSTRKMDYFWTIFGLFWLSYFLALF